MSDETAEYTEGVDANTIRYDKHTEMMSQMLAIIDDWPVLVTTKNKCKHKT
jgi:hypothetical protein